MGGGGTALHGDAIKEIAKYPTVALGWMMYVGMAVAHYWDVDWEVYGKIENLYEYIRDKRGFDEMDEYVRETVLGFRPDAKPAEGQPMNEYDGTEELVRMLSTICLTQIRREQIEPQSLWHSASTSAVSMPCTSLEPVWSFIASVTK